MKIRNNKINAKKKTAFLDEATEKVSLLKRGVEFIKFCSSFCIFSYASSTTNFIVEYL
jgi:hypothetical protein